MPQASSASLEAEKLAHSGRAASLEADKATLEADKAALEAKLAELQAALDAARAAADGADKDSAALRAQLAVRGHTV